MDKPSFYAIIPAHVRYCKEIEPGAKLLYGEITALASSEGYCWATNQYFASLYETDERTIRRWISSLLAQRFISTEVIIEGIQRRRKIWISHEIKKSFAKGQKCPDVRTKMSPRGDKNDPCINTKSNTNNKDKEPPTPPKGGEYEEYGDYVRLRKGEFEKLVEYVGSADDVNRMIEDLTDYVLSKGLHKKYKDHAATIRSFWRREKTKMDQISNKPSKVAPGENKVPSESFQSIGSKWWSGIIQDRAVSDLIYKGKVTSDTQCVILNPRTPDPQKVYYGEKNFQLKVTHFLKKMGIAAKQPKDIYDSV